MLKVVNVLIAALVGTTVANKFYSNSDDLVKEINNAQNLWKASSNEITKKGTPYMRSLLGANIPENIPRKTHAVNFLKVFSSIPESFDARQKWPQCNSISSLKDQGHCGSCWAVAVAAAASDRLCIQSNFTINVNLSAQNLMSCCSFCYRAGTNGCQGGDPGRAWYYFKSNGIVTGGDYSSGEGCQPYDVEPTGGDGRFFFFRYTPRCYRTCTNKNYGVSYNTDKHYGSLAYILPRSESAIQAEIMKNGSVVGTLKVYQDFIHYSSGIYTRISSKYLGGHAIKIIGWGVENGVKYWLAANSWSEKWGEDGFFRIKRGNNECDFENFVTAGLVRA